MGFREEYLYRKHLYILTQKRRGRKIHIWLLKKGKGRTGEECQDGTVQLGQGGTVLKNNF